MAAYETIILGRLQNKKKTDDLKTLAKLALAPHLILDIFILDKYRLVLTPLPHHKFGQKLVNIYFHLVFCINTYLCLLHVE